MLWQPHSSAAPASGFLCSGLCERPTLPPPPVSRLLAILAALVLLPISAPLLPAQVAEQPTFASGQRARITYLRLRTPLIGNFISADSLEFVVRGAADRQAYYVPWANVAYLETSVGQRTRAQTMNRGTASGFLLGVALGVSVVLANEAMWWNAGPYRENAKEAALIGVGITTIGGAILGLTWPTETWQRVPLHGNPTGPSSLRDEAGAP